jgi:NAD-dependent deacetylase
MPNATLAAARAALARSRRVAVFSGAGLSAESGIATFRGHGEDALWAQHNPMELASPEGFARDPERVIAWYNWRRGKLATARPNAAHLALAAHPELVEITQNVDDLLERAGISAARIHHLHGTIGKDRCNAACGYEETVDLASPPPLRACPRCGAPLRPAVVWFGESLPPNVWSEAQGICAKLDCLIVVGTSALVYPAASLINAAAAAGAAIVSVNTEATGSFGASHLPLVGPASEVLPELLAGLALATRVA